MGLRLRFAELASRVEGFMSESTNGMAAPSCQGYGGAAEWRRGLCARGGVWAGLSGPDETAGPRQPIST